MNITGLLAPISDPALELIAEVTELDHRQFRAFMQWLDSYVVNELEWRRGETQERHIADPNEGEWSAEEKAIAGHACWTTGAALLALKTDEASEEYSREAAKFFAALHAKLTEKADVRELADELIASQHSPATSPS